MPGLPPRLKSLGRRPDVSGPTNDKGLRGQSLVGKAEATAVFCDTDNKSVKPTVKAQIRAALERGEALTSGDAWRRFGTSRLGAIVHRLRCEGMRIASRIVPVDTADGRVAHVAEYREEAR